MQDTIFNSSKEGFKKINSKAITKLWLTESYINKVFRHSIESISKELKELIESDIIQSLHSYVYEKKVIDTLISNAIYRSYILYNSQNRTIIDKVWKEKYMQATAIYNNETTHDRKVMTLYHVMNCYRKDHSDICELYAHEERLRRRPLFLKNTWNYYPIEGEENNKAHNEIEIEYHPLMYKSRMCSRNTCSNKFCPDAHDLKDLRPLANLYNTKYNNMSYTHHFNLETYKTQPCISHIKCDNSYCEYYHKAEERRRHIGYLPLMCENGINCYKRDKCEYCHTENEYKYHPERYKVLYAKGNEKEAFKEIGIEYDKAKEMLEAYKSIEKDWVCSKCKNPIYNPKDIYIFQQFIICKSCQEIFDEEHD